MKLTLDTKEDSHEHLRHVIAMLQSIIGGSEQDVHEPGQQPVSQDQGFVNLFGADSPSLPEPKKDSSLDVDPAKIQDILQKASLEKARMSENKEFKIEEYL